MVWVADKHANLCRAWLGHSGPVNPRKLAKRFDIEMIAIEMDERIDALYLDHVVCVRNTLATLEFDHVFLHEIGHWVIHNPRGGYHFWKQCDPTMLNKIERQAEDFAYIVHLPSAELLRLLLMGVHSWEIARVYRRSHEWMRERIEIASRAGELDALRWVA